MGLLALKDETTKNNVCDKCIMFINGYCPMIDKPVKMTDTCPSFYSKDKYYGAYTLSELVQVLKKK
jgi:hypothetical protein